MSAGLRVTQRSVANTMLSGLQANLTRSQNIQEQLSSGRQINRPSDSPVKTVEAMQFRSELRRSEQYIRNADDGLALLATTDSALTTALSMTRRANDLAVQGRSGAMSAAAREAIAVEVDAIREGLLNLANTRYLDRPVFGGNTNNVNAFDADGVYVGDEEKVSRTTAAGTQVKVTLPGTEVFGAAGEDSQLFDVLKGMSAALRGLPMEGGVVSLADGLDKLGAASERIITKLGIVGASVNRVESMRTRAEEQLITLTTSLSEVENIDLPKTIVEMQMQEVAYKAALGATARVVQPSLLDFLR